MCPSGVEFVRVSVCSWGPVVGSGVIGPREADAVVGDARTPVWDLPCDPVTDRQGSCHTGWEPGRAGTPAWSGSVKGEGVGVVK